MIEILLTRKWENLSELNIAIIAELMGFLGISTKIIDAADLSLAGSGTERLVSICKELNANGYISNKGAAEYLEESLFFDAGVPLCVVRQNVLYTTHRDKPGFPTSFRPCAPGTPQMDDRIQVSVVCRLLLSTGVSVRNRIVKSGC